MPAEDGELNKHTPKHLLSKSCFLKKAVGMYHSTLERPMKRFSVLITVAKISGGLAARYIMQNWDVHKIASHPGISVF